MINDFIIEGSYKDGQFQKEKEFDSNGKIIYEGIYKDGKRWQGLEKKYIDDNLLYEKVYKEGKIVRGKEYNIINKKIIFEGEYKNGKILEGTLNEYSKGVFDKKYKLVNYKDKTLHILLDEKKVKKEFDGNGFIREYKNNILIFEGE